MKIDDDISADNGSETEINFRGCELHSSLNSLWLPQRGPRIVIHTNIVRMEEELKQKEFCQELDLYLTLWKRVSRAS